MFGTLQPESDAWNSVLGVMLTRDWNESHARIFVSWASGVTGDTTNSKGQYTDYIFGDEFQSWYLQRSRLYWRVLWMCGAHQRMSSTHCYRGIIVSLSLFKSDLRD
jgi:hypothetical protein